MDKNIILDHREIEHKIKRIAYQIYETFVDEQEIVVAGIASNGYIFAQKIAAALESISDIRVLLCEVRLNKQQPNSPITTSLTKDAYTDKGLVLVDDVLNSGSTLVYGAKHFLDVPLKKFKTEIGRASCRASVEVDKGVGIDYEYLRE